jgi:hypothetical protein
LTERTGRRPVETIDRSKEILMLIRRLSAAAAVLIPLALAAPVSTALADTTPTASSPSAVAPPRIVFVPPRVGPLSVNLGPTIIDGQMISPGVNVVSPGVSLPPIAWTLPL